jgi:hypothetical protein
VQAAGYAGAHVLQNEEVEKRNSCTGQHVISCVRRTVQEIRGMLGERYFRRAYRMPYEWFCRLHAILARRITAARLKARQDKLKGGRVGRRGGRYKLPPIHNGRISTSVRLACALRYFASGSPYDIMVKYGISHTDVMDSVWYVVHAVNTTSEFKIKYPSCEVEQTRIAAGFEQASEVRFSNCAGATDGVLFWMQKPMLKEARRVGVDQAKFFMLSEEQIWAELPSCFQREQ